jgi:16S rRNA (guanine527-N7)-methyltransferase
MDDLVSSARGLLNISLTDAQQEAFQIYENELVTWNKRHNLTAIDEPRQIRSKHFLDSLSCLLAIDSTESIRMVDVGSGAGFPGIPLKIVNPKIQLTLLESIGKKVDFCRHICQELGFKGVKIIQNRAEEFGHLPQAREGFDWALARAVAGLPVLVEYLLPLVRIGGRALAMKGENGPAEAQAAEPAIDLLGGQISRLVPVNLPGIEEDRYLVVIDKIAATPDRYPRRVGIPVKRPLRAG